MESAEIISPRGLKYIHAEKSRAASEITMTPTDLTDFDSFGWVRHYFPHLDHVQMDSILSFSLIWNLFEARICDKFASVKRIRDKVDGADRSGSLRQDSYEQYLNYFRNRYGPRGVGALDELAPP